MESYVAKFSGNNYRFHLGKMLGLAQFYFPQFEKAFIKEGVPLEIKYLSIIESSLNPAAVSRVGATGTWQFMHATAKEHGLTIDSHMDERRDPVAASYAAARYLREAYEQFGDWLLAIASYNCGKGKVSRAIERSGQANPTFWSIQHLLPKETQNYIPSFIAMYHVLENHQQYGIVADVNNLPESIETIMVDRVVNLNDVAKAIGVERDFIKTLNPAYKREVVNGSPLHVKKLVVPQVDKSDYAALYAALQGTPQKQTNKSEEVRLAKSTTPLKHAIRRGETLGMIAKKYKVTVEEIKAWNNLKSNRIESGKQLSIQAPGTLTAENTIDSQYITYKVKRGDTLSAIAQRHKEAPSRT